MRPWRALLSCVQARGNFPRAFAVYVGLFSFFRTLAGTSATGVSPPAPFSLVGEFEGVSVTDPFWRSLEDRSSV